MSKLKLQPGISKVSVMYSAQECKEELVGCWWLCLTLCWVVVVFYWNIFEVVAVVDYVWCYVERSQSLAETSLMLLHD